MTGQDLTFMLLKSWGGISEDGGLRISQRPFLLAFAPRARVWGEPAGRVFLLAAPAAPRSQGDAAAGLTRDWADKECVSRLSSSACRR